MKKLVLPVAVFLICLSGLSQNSIAVKAGYLDGIVKLKDTSTDASESISEDGGFAGIAYEMKTTGKFSVEPSILYGNIGGSSWLIIPLMAKYYLRDRLHIQAGPQVTWTLEDTQNYGNSLGFDMNFGIGYDIGKKLSFEVFYSAELTNRTPDELDFSNLELEGFPDTITLKTTINTLRIGLKYRLK